MFVYVKKMKSMQNVFGANRLKTKAYLSSVHLEIITICPFSIPAMFLLGQGVVSPRCMDPRAHSAWPGPPPPPWSLSDSGWLWARSGLGLDVMGGSGCCTDMVRRRCVRLHRKSGLADRPNEPFRRTIRTEELFLGRALWLNCREERCTA